MSWQFNSINSSCRLSVQNVGEKKDKIKGIIKNKKKKSQNKKIKYQVNLVVAFNFPSSKRLKEKAMHLGIVYTNSRSYVRM